MIDGDDSRKSKMYSYGKLKILIQSEFSIDFFSEEINDSYLNMLTYFEDGGDITRYPQGKFV